MSEEKSTKDKRRELEERLAQATARRDEAEKSVNEKRELRELEIRIAAEERAVADAEAIAAAEAEYGIVGVGIAVIKTDEGTVIVKRPARTVHQRFEKRGMKGPDLEYQAEEAEYLVKSCLVYPDKATFNALLNVLPGVLTIAANEAYALGRGKRTEVQGK